MSSLIKWHRDKNGIVFKDGQIYPSWYAEINGNTVAGASMTGRQGVDHYPWDWHTDNDFGVTDSLKSAKEQVAESLKKHVTPQNCPLQNDWKNWSEDKKRDRLFMICPACKVSGSHVRL